MTDALTLTEIADALDTLADVSDRMDELAGYKASFWRGAALVLRRLSKESADKTKAASHGGSG